MNEAHEVAALLDVYSPHWRDHDVTRQAALQCFPVLGDTFPELFDRPPTETINFDAETLLRCEERTRELDALYPGWRDDAQRRTDAIRRAERAGGLS